MSMRWLANWLLILAKRERRIAPGSGAVLGRNGTLAALLRPGPVPYEGDLP